MQDIGEGRQERDFMTIKKLSVCCSILLFLTACGNDDSSQILADQLGVVDLRIDLNDPDNQVLRRNGYKYFEGGRRGIIVIANGVNNFTAFERNCTFQFNNTCATVSVHSSQTFLLDSCCSSQFDLNGQVIQPPASDPLIKYSTFLIGSELRVQFP
jgi:hypothetical protein